VVAAGVGLWFFSDSPDQNISWVLPWLGAVGLASLSLWCSPAIGILEGCNHIAVVNAYRLAQAIIGNLVVWAVMILGGGLWAVVASAAVRLGVELWLIRRRFAAFWARLLSARDPELPAGLSWKQEVLPLQWRIAAQSIVGWFALQAYTPIIFKYHRSVLGGRMGMTWTAITTIQMAAYAWTQTRIPEMGRLISEGRRDESRRFLKRVLSASVCVYLLAVAAFLGLILLLEKYKPAIAERVLDPFTVLLFAIGMGLSLVVYCLGVFVRAHKIDPFLRIGISTSLVMGILVWWLGATVGPRGAALAHIGVTGLFVLPAYVMVYRQMAGPNTEALP
jgi:O-antigen/teichoic acid export membrane protein